VRLCPLAAIGTSSALLDAQVLPLRLVVEVVEVVHHREVAHLEAVRHRDVVPRPVRLSHRVRLGRRLVVVRLARRLIRTGDYSAMTYLITFEYVVRYYYPLYLGGSFVNLSDFGVSHISFHWIISHIAVSTKDLNAFDCAAHSHFG